ncbi:hypothetical protein ACFW2T_11290 [Streptomyces sp. NPDC058892]|uniref:hypothetical protein n=1 Tax=unclassified Streptomyces TaxID=2593676 RepID=UPI0036C93008
MASGPSPARAPHPGASPGRLDADSRLHGKHVTAVGAAFPPAEALASQLATPPG